MQFYTVIFLFLAVKNILAEQTLCDDWTAYNDEKCIKIFDETLIRYSAAHDECSQFGSLLVIKSQEEQDFMTNFLFNVEKMTDNIWIGISKLNDTYKGDDNTDITYTNWVEGSPQNETDYNCAQMLPEKSSLGKWINEPCSKKNAFVCQKLQNWSISRLQKTLLDERKQTQETISKLLLELNRHNAIISNLEANQVPIGFIYVQLANQNEPKTIWPLYTWNDISSSYGGLFFRVLGGSSESFGSTQESSSPRLSKIYWAQSFIVNQNTVTKTGSHEDSVAAGQWSALYSAGNYQNGNPDGIRFYISGDENRPRNQAVKIWKRTA